MKMICGLPRSRTAWLSAWLTDDYGICSHEGISSCKTISQYKSLYDDTYFADSTTAGPVLKSVSADRLIILRDPKECHQSTTKALGHDLGLDWFNNQFEELSSLDGLRISFNKIDESLDVIWDYIKGTPLNKDRASLFKKMNIAVKSHFGFDKDAAESLLSEVGLWRG